MMYEFTGGGEYDESVADATSADPPEFICTPWRFGGLNIVTLKKNPDTRDVYKLQYVTDEAAHYVFEETESRLD